MMVLVSYDVRTVEGNGQRRLRRLATACRDFGQRVQFSVFEIEVDPAQWVALRARLLEIIEPDVDCLRFYFLGSEWKSKVEHVGAKAVRDLNGPLVI
jgi:CRISPR-associated protein Cas2